MMKLVLVLISLSFLASLTSGGSFEKSAKWKLYKKTYQKVYKNAVEEQMRYRIWSEKVKIVAEHNQKFAEGKTSYKKRINKFSDMTAQEVRDRRVCFNERENDDKLKHQKKFVRNPNVTVPDEKDWRNDGAVTGVKDQGSCGSCYSFSVTGAIEGQLFLSTGNLVSLSEQQIVDCSNEDGCEGGDQQSVFEYLVNEENGGMNSGEEYKYEGEQGDECRFDPDEVVATIEGYQTINAGDEDALKEAVGTLGPIAISIDATENFEDYDSGIYHDINCVSDELNHAMLVVGYGRDGDFDYWIVKNSYVSYGKMSAVKNQNLFNKFLHSQGSDDFGEGGYIRMIRNYGNNCGIASEPSVPTGVQLKKRNPKKFQTIRQYFTELSISIEKRFD